MIEKVDSMTNEHILEIRYKPNPKILDHRGRWAEEISSFMELKNWRIIENRIDIYSDNEIEHAFVGFKNAGFTSADAPTKNFFSDRASKLFRFLFDLSEFGDTIFVERIGVRSRFCTPYDGAFEELVNQYTSKYLNLTPLAKEAIGPNAKLIDVGAPLNFVDRLGNFNTSCGPMLKKQLNEFFKKSQGFPDVGLYFDHDYFVRPDRLVKGKEIISQIKSFAEEAWDRHDRIRRLIMDK